MDQRTDQTGKEFMKSADTVCRLMNRQTQNDEWKAMKRNHPIEMRRRTSKRPRLTGEPFGKPNNVHSVLHLYNYIVAYHILSSQNTSISRHLLVWIISSVRCSCSYE